MATTFAVRTLLAHDRLRRDHWRPGRVLGPLALVATILSSEEGLAVCGLLGAYAIVLDRGPRRLRALAPYAGVVITWLLIYARSATGSTASRS